MSLKNKGEPIERAMEEGIRKVSLESAIGAILEF